MQTDKVESVADKGKCRRDFAKFVWVPRISRGEGLPSDSRLNAPVLPTSQNHLPDGDSNEMPLHLLHISLDHPTFRLPSLISVAEVFDFPITFVSEDKFRSVLVVELERDEHVERLLERATMIR